MNVPAELRGSLRLAFDAVEGVTEIVEGVHRNLAAPPFGEVPRGGAPGIAGFVYGCVRRINALVRAGVDLGLAMPGFAKDEREVSGEPWLAALNGVLGDHLERTGNPLAIPMRFRVGGRALDPTSDAIREAIPEPRDRLLVLLHGLCMNDLQWTRARDDGTSHDHGRALASALGFTPVWLHYNSGRHISTNGREFAALLGRLIDAWPVPLRSVTLVGHSMGGLVIRSALHVADEARAPWLSKVDRAVYLGSPHHGAVLERAGNRLHAAVAWSRYTAPLAGLGAIRSAGITDLRHGSVLDADWRDHGRFDHHVDRRHPAPLVAGIEHYAIAATLSPESGATASPGALLGRLLGDGLVHPSSATGRHPEPERDLGFSADRVRILRGLGHLEMLSSPAVYAQLESWLGPAASTR